MKPDWNLGPGIKGGKKRMKPKPHYWLCFSSIRCKRVNPGYRVQCTNCGARRP